MCSCDRRIRPATLLLIGLVASVAHAQPYPLVGRMTASYAAADPPMQLPTAVTVAPDGTVYVVDGVNDRIVPFTSAGDPLEPIHTIGPEALEHPVSARADAAGRLWITDTENRRVLVRGPAGALERVVPVPASVADHAHDLTDVLLTPAGRHLWLVDNDNHRLLRLDLETNELMSVGRYGESLGTFYYPFMLATLEDELLVVDVLNGRVQRLTADGVPTGSVGAYGVRLGEFFRPKGVAVDTEGRVWVSDSELGVVQAFTRDGRVIDVLRDDSGHPLRFEHPIGLGGDSAGRLYVVEALANRVRRIEIQYNANAPRPTADRRTAARTEPQPKACTACHFEWMQPLAEGVSTELAEVPPNPPEHPWVSRAERCLGCHDGGVGDSRRRVWVEHGHRIGIKPPESITVPDDLPLADGAIACRTCHSAHGRAGASTLAEIVFLRIQDSPAELCMSCHSDYREGVAEGMHPLGAMPAGVPAELVHLSGAQAREQVTCLACHTGHGAEHDRLLVLDPDTNDLCLACHQSLTPQLFGEETRSKHGRLPTLDEQQQKVAAQFNSRLGPDQQLLCATCHKSHHAVMPDYLLAFDPSAQDTCAACHATCAEVVGSAHDLRTNHPDFVNVAGETVAAGGACSGCHTAHQDAILPAPNASDPTGRCVNCHQPGGLPTAKVLGPVNHPESACAECHNPHLAHSGNFLKAEPKDLCRECHAEQFTLVGGPHDVQPDATGWPEVAAKMDDRCLACHRTHGDEDTGLFRAGLAQAHLTADRACLACHPDAARAADTSIALLHPRSAIEVPDAVALPVVHLENEPPQLACKSCHDPHSGPSVHGALLRADADAHSEALCLKCHIERANVHMIGHAESHLAAAGFEVGACQPCHVTHGSPQAVERDVMWPLAMSRFEGADATPIADHYCLACHRTGGPVVPPAIASHPNEQMFNPYLPGEPGYLPLYNALGEVDPAGFISCRTCHLTHGRTTPAPLPAGMPNISEREQRARAWHVRSFGASNVCNTCHGFDALRRFMYFHDPARRGGPIETGTVPAPRPPAPG